MRSIPFTAQHYHLIKDWLSNWREVIQWSGCDYGFPLSEKTLTYMAEGDGAANKSQSCSMFEYNDVLKGHYQIVRDPINRSARLRRILIAPEFRGHGFGKALLHFAITDALSELQTERVELSVFSWNKPALRIYENAGFRHEGSKSLIIRSLSEEWEILNMVLLRGDFVRTGARTNVYEF